MASRITWSVLRQISSRCRQIKPPEEVWCLVEAVTSACRAREHPAQTCSCGCRLRTAYRFREYHRGYFCYTRLKLSFPPYTTLPLQVYFDIVSYLTNLKAFFHHLRFSFLFVFDPSSSPTANKRLHGRFHVSLYL